MKNTNVLFLCIGCIIGWGAFILPQDLFLTKIGFLESIIGLILGGLAICLIASNYLFLLQYFQKSGGEFYFTLKVLGRTHGFICGWFLSLAYLCIIPLNATALGVISHAFIPHNDIVLYSLNNRPIYLIDIAISLTSILLIGIINIFGKQTAFILQKILTLILCISIAFFFLIMCFNSLSWSNLSSYLQFHDINFRAIMIVFSLAPWIYLGFDCAVQIIESIRYRKHIFSTFTYFAIWIGCLLYCMLICITAFGINIQEIQESKWATHTSIKTYFGDLGSFILCIAVLGAIFSGINGFFIATNKIFESLSTHDFLSKNLIDKNRFQISYKIIFLITALSCIMSLFGREALLYIVDMACIGIIIGFLYVSIISFIVKKNHKKHFSVASLCSIFLSGLFLLLAFLPFSPAALKLPSIIALLLWSLLGFFCFYFLKQE